MSLLQILLLLLFVKFNLLDALVVKKLDLTDGRNSDQAAEIFRSAGNQLKDAREVRWMSGDVNSVKSVRLTSIDHYSYWAY